MSEPAKNYTRVDEHGAIRIEDTGVAIEWVLYPFLDGVSPEEICRRFPSLTLEQVYGAITYYLANRPAMDRYLADEDAAFEADRARYNQKSELFIRRMKAAARAEGAA